MSATKPTSVAAWKGPQTEIVTLPSGNVAELRDTFPVYMLLRTGQISPELFEVFQQWQEGELEDTEHAGELVDLMITSMFVSPRVTVDGADGTISVEQIPDPDIDAVLERASGGSLDRGFPEQPAGADDRADSAHVRRPSKPAARPATSKPRSARSRSKAR